MDRGVPDPLAAGTTDDSTAITEQRSPTRIHSGAVHRVMGVVGGE